MPRAVGEDSIPVERFREYHDGDFFDRGSVVTVVGRGWRDVKSDLSVYNPSHLVPSFHVLSCMNRVHTIRYCSTSSAMITAVAYTGIPERSELISVGKRGTVVINTALHHVEQIRIRRRRVRFFLHAWSRCCTVTYGRARSHSPFAIQLSPHCRTWLQLPSEMTC